ncbi:SOS-induced cell division inhibitor SulA [Pseudomonas sp. KNUC1026]|uniref:SOS-induced cell division inhibitor SulA n=1 Tax=Pseudomonas sp. KNUC1026 TaxID=2893890 RepID=UPI001F1DDEEB|nr:SOS-induced cell division inhibitor SulA [Pseudomonas sp. KNUC1026]UFH50752.1 CDP-glycerol--UDP-pyrophosphoryl-N-acetylglucosaminyl-N-acetylmannosamine glycerophosphotransferase [Pseudomonas sp. KNUC1026]
MQQCIPAVTGQGQLPLFEAFMAPAAKPLFEPTEPEHTMEDVFSELALKGSAGSCMSLMAPILSALSQAGESRWLTLVAPPAALTHAWLRDAGLNRERILLLQPRAGQSSQALVCDVLRLGKSHTVVSWLNPLNVTARRQLARAAEQGQAQSLNIRLG